MWEDEQCKEGGRIVIRLPKNYTNKYWEDIVLAMIGEQFSVADEVLGVQVSFRPNQDTLSLWTKNAKDSSKVDKLKEEFKTILPIEEGMNFDYEIFSEAAKQAKEHKEHKHHDNNEFRRDDYVPRGRGGRGGYRGDRGGRGRGQ